MLSAQKVDFWHFLRLVFVFFLGGTILSMFALQLSPQYRETAMELTTLRRESRASLQQIREKSETLKTADKKIRMIGAEVIRLNSLIEEETRARKTAEGKLTASVEDNSQKSREMERIGLAKTQAEQQIAEKTKQVDKLKREMTVLQAKATKDTKESDAKIADLEAAKFEGESCHTTAIALKNELEALKLEHDQAKKESLEQEAKCDSLKKQMEERNQATSKVVKQLEQKDLQTLLDPDATIPTESEKLDTEKIVSLLPTDTPAPTPQEGDGRSNEDIASSPNEAIVPPSESPAETPADGSPATDFPVVGGAQGAVDGPKAESKLTPSPTSS
eukprot:TRINITY_DN17300_c0_g1_i1.p1 TRINITY_DN17300_c0_g1~~TRINITY_DN17300_c0_g1_i1.p1  ORF type:complete len:332 (-),score=81.88 TRINITY_DN17300_c0_g1_i1:235-1230(-)